jgi:hypothetical protein
LGVAESIKCCSDYKCSTIWDSKAPSIKKIKNSIIRGVNVSHYVTFSVNWFHDFDDGSLILIKV